MSKRNHEIVEEYKQVFRKMLDSPSIAEVKGTWYLFEQEGREPKILLDNGSGFFIDEPFTVDRIQELGWTMTPVIVHKIIADR